MESAKVVLANAMALHVMCGLLLLQILLWTNHKERWSCDLREGLQNRDPAALFAAGVFVGIWPIFYLVGICRATWGTRE